MNTYRKILGLFLFLTFLSPLYASKECCNLASGCPTTPVVTESPAYTFEAYISALFLKPSGGLYFGVELETTTSPNFNVLCLKPKYHAAFDLGFKIICHESDTALTLNWERFRSCICAARNIESDNSLMPFFGTGASTAVFKNASAQARFSFDEINLDLGKLVRFGDDVRSNLYGGISFVRIQECLTSTFSNDEATIVRSIALPICFSGVGPQVGIDTKYCVWEGFNLKGKASSSLLVGNIKNHTQFNSLNPDLELFDITPPNRQRLCVCKTFAVVPAFEEKIGASYSFTYGDNCLFDIEVGYQAQIYLNALQSVDVTSEIVLAPLIGVFPRTFGKSSNNFALAGPYITFDFAF